jgi:ATP-dependent Clp protease adaptor protein ClpS
MGVQYNALEAVSPPQPAGPIKRNSRPQACQPRLNGGHHAMESDETVVVEPDEAATMVAQPKKERKRKEREVPRYNVVLWDSDVHSYEYVERMLRELFGHSTEECHKMAETVDTQGKVIVLTTTKEHAELKRDQILAYGKDDLIKNCQGSMHATIESVG